MKCLGELLLLACMTIEKTELQEDEISPSHNTIKRLSFDSDLGFSDIGRCGISAIPC